MQAIISLRNMAPIAAMFLASTCIFMPTKADAIAVIPDKNPLAKGVKCDICIENKKGEKITIKFSADEVYGFKITPEEIADLGGWIKEGLKAVIGFFAGNGNSLPTLASVKTVEGRIAIDGLNPNWTSTYNSDGSADLFAIKSVDEISDNYTLFDKILVEASLPKDTTKVLGLKLISTAFGSSGAIETTESVFVPPTDGSIGNIVECPGPLPILGAAAAFGYSRKLRKSIKDSNPEVISITAV